MAQGASLIRTPESPVERGSLPGFAGVEASRSQQHAPIRQSAAGLVLLDASFQPIYANDEAIQILAYPDDPARIANLDRFLLQKIHALFAAPLSPEHGFVTEFQSGRRTYQCRAFPLNQFHGAGRADHPALVLLVERKCWTSLDSTGVAERYRLTPRERETLYYVIHGLTNKEIGRRMSLSPHTVKAFLKLVMMKMEVRNRSGAIRKALDFRE